MAPLRPLPSRRATPTKSILKKNDVSKSAKSRPEPLFATSKEDKRRIKHAQLISKVTKSATSKPRRRRPNKKLVTTLDALADALPEDEDASAGGTSDVTNGAAGSKATDQVNVIKRKSMKSRPGAMKRKQKLESSERDRFAKNLAQMSAPNSATEPILGIASTTDKLKALRGFISQTLEKRTDVASAK